MSMVLFVAIHTLLKTEKERRDIGGASLLVIVERMGCIRMAARIYLHWTARAWCRVVEFAEEFGISIAYNSLLLGERRGG